MCEILKGVPMGHPTFRPLENSRHQHIHSELLEDNNIDALDTLGVHPIRNQLRQYPLCNVYRLWEPDELHQLLLGLVKDILNWLLKYLKARNLKNQFDNRLTLVQRYPGLQHFSKPFDSLKSGTWQGKEIRGMIRSLAVNCPPLLVCSKDDRKAVAQTAFDEMVMGAARSLCQFTLLVSQQNHSDLSLKALDDALNWFYKKTASDEMVVGAVRALCEFSLLVSQQNHSDLSLNALDDALKRFNQQKGIFREQTMSKSVKAKVDDLVATESH